MKIIVVANPALKKEILEQGAANGVQVEWADELTWVSGADCYIDLLFIHSPERIEALKKLQPTTIIINSVINAADKLPGNFIRVNGWFTFLKRSVIEASCRDVSAKKTAEKIFNSFNKTPEWVPDVPGFISARVVSMIINEAYFVLDEKVSTKEEIDTAMKLGTNYPFGPFEWSEKIGLKNIYDLLQTLAQSDSRYKPSALLSKEALML
jgi:3-hydroxybutyryl-CoA dehydrogenase